ncbi:4-oxalocrotonate tautomerase [mine drainage metagenome]|uniref:4-oxalocrotonate tautomerase n=1 Tax=mine drainage metagenome TaxID=410659 RepID=T1BZB5_9ZZZZ
MLYLNAKISGNPSPELTKQAADTLANLTTNIPHKKRELTSITIEYVDGGKWFVAGTPISSQQVKTFYLDIHVTEGTNTKDEKANYVKEVFSSMQSVLGKLHPASYIIIKNVSADSWGYEGATQEFRYIKGKAL